ncbi:MAG: hypothetical protein Q7K45_06440, partial [Nanoarchaeota archaeon]|nr:hypothetical protein [Nanoarchaeota archaeon]
IIIADIIIVIVMALGILNQFYVERRLDEVYAEKDAEYKNLTLRNAHLSMRLVSRMSGMFGDGEFAGQAPWSLAPEQKDILEYMDLVEVNLDNYDKSIEKLKNNQRILYVTELIMLTLVVIINLAAFFKEGKKNLQ